MRRLFALLIVLSLLLTACGNSASSGGAEFAVRDLAAAALSSQSDLPDLHGIYPGDDIYETSLKEYYGLDSSLISDGVICLAGGVQADEAAVLQFEDRSSASEAEELLLAYLERRAGDFAGYAPDEEAQTKEGTAASSGCYAALFILPDAEAAKQAFLDCFDTGLPDVSLDDFLIVAENPEPDGSSSSSSGSSDTSEDDSSEPAGSESGPGNGPDASAPDTSASASGSTSIPGFTPPPPSAPVEPGPVPTPTPAVPSAPVNPEPPASSAPPDSSGASSSAAPETPDSSTPAPDTSQTPETPPPEETDPAEDVYDPEAVKAAFQTGDTSALTPGNLAVLQTCQSVLATLTPEMTPYEKELVIHDWMIAHAEYDPVHLSHESTDEMTPGSDTPIGFLINGKGICLGYTSTFQLFMDLAGIQCISVNGFSSSGTEDHAWNMVFLDGEWYCVDCTWDDPVAPGTVPDTLHHKYFNVTTDFLKQNDHQWDESLTPPAAATYWSWAEVQQRSSGEPS